MKELTTKDVVALLNEGKSVNIIDVREVDEVAAGKIPGAVNIPLGLIGDSLNDLDQTKEYIMVCRSGARSGRATQFLESQGYQVSNMKGGMLAWNGEIV
ncbi:rhodanese-like domain-containing protein [Neobacillus sp. LXY-4]|uniref:rhodanese-like domain-containing protein n=1 Tax=Neobacillus sp. LXY-4 TaxID=3379826 RepID=UPI003EE00EAA